MSSMTLLAANRLMSWQNAADTGVRRWSMSGNELGITVVMVGDGDVELVEDVDEVDLVHEIDEAIMRMGGDYE